MTAGSRRWRLAAAVVLLVVLAGCTTLSGEGDAPKATSPNDTSTNGSPSSGPVPVSDLSGYTDAGLPNVSGIDDGASFDLGDRVIWLNETDRSSLRQEEDVFRIDIRRPEGTRPPSEIHAGFVLRNVLQDTETARLEPYPPDANRDEMYNGIRRYLADAIVVERGGERHDRTVVLSAENGSYRVQVGDRWPGGPTLDPWDPPHTLVVEPALGPGVNATLRRNDSQVFSKTVDLTTQNTEIHRFERPGNYTVTLHTSDDERYETGFRVELITIADCNHSGHHLTLEDGSLTSGVRSGLAGCTDPGDTRYGAPPPNSTKP